MITTLIGAVLVGVSVAAVAALVVGAVRGRVQVRSCCSVPADQDGRLAAVTGEPGQEPSAPQG